jgi:hypothetical protein
MLDTRTHLKPQMASPAALRQRYGTLGATASKIIDWEAFHYGMQDHKFLNDPNQAVADHRHTIYELWVGDLIENVMSGEMPVYSKDGELPKRLAEAEKNGQRDSDILIGCMFETQKLLESMDAFFTKHHDFH